jgi:general L-amino acid transport system ATP-binding protein
MPETEVSKAPNEAPAILMSGVHKWFGDFHALNDVSLKVRQGEKIVICGPSGSGKSTLIRCINRLEPHDEGRIVVDGHELTGDLRQIETVRSEVGMVFQQFNLFPHRSVLDNVTEAPRHVLRLSREQAEAEAEQLLHRVGLGDKLRARPATLSGGQQQRVAIARALAMKPEAILFDEPTSSLDPRMTAEVISVMADLARSGQTMMVVTHALSFARSVAHSVHVMHEGRVAESGTPEQVFEAPEQDVTRAFLAEARVANRVE